MDDSDSPLEERLAAVPDWGGGLAAEPAERLPPQGRPLGTSELVGLFVRLRPQIERVLAGRVGSAAVAADLLQDLFLRLARIDERLATQDEARRYLMKMAVNASIDHLRTECRRVELLAGIAELFDAGERTPEDFALAQDQLRAIDAALAELPEKCREMLYLSRVEGLTHAEIAQRMGVSRSLVEKYVVRAVLHCRSRLTGEV
ncbi:MAG: RNA polymerase sigma factor [Gammaproteobacteria bacterium]